MNLSITTDLMLAGVVTHRATPFDQRDILSKTNLFSVMRTRAKKMVDWLMLREVMVTLGPKKLFTKMTGI
jgi:hypothetical protein